MTIVDDIKARLDIVQVVSQYVPLQKAGRNYKAPCPFHSERTPSFIVTPDRQSWHCFGACGTGGDVFSFLMKREGLEFAEAMKVLAERAGVELSFQPKEKTDEVSRLYRINDIAASYFHHLLMSSPEAEGARRYLKQRGLQRATVEEFQVGYSQPQGDALMVHMAGQGYSREDMMAAGLVTRLETGEVRDLFRGRLMFSIRDEKGRPIGFGGRVLGEGGPKYINSPQTSVFDKSSILYGLDRARGSIRQESRAVIVEGYMDVLITHQHGYKNAVASMGTALTEKHVTSLKRLASRVSLAMDSDTAGEEATLRSLESTFGVSQRVVHKGLESRMHQTFLATSDLVIDVVVLPAGRDPDEMILADPKAWEELLKNPVPLLDYYIDALVSRADLNAPGAKNQVLERVLPLLVTTPSLDQDRYVRKLSKVLAVPEFRVNSAINTHVVRSPKSGRSKREAPPRAREASPTSREASERGGNTLEEYVLALLIQHPEMRQMVAGLSPEAFQDHGNRAIFHRWVGDAGFDPAQETLPQGLSDRMERLAALKLPEESDDKLKRGLAESLNRLEARRLKKLKEEERHILSQGESLEEVAGAIYQRALEVNTRLRKLHSQGQGIQRENP